MGRLHDRAKMNAYLRLIGCALLLLAGQAQAQAPMSRSTGQTLYLPIYSHVWHGDLDSRGEPARALVSISVSSTAMNISSELRNAW